MPLTLHTQPRTCDPSQMINPEQPRQSPGPMRRRGKTMKTEGVAMLEFESTLDSSPATVHRMVDEERQSA